MVSDYNSRKNEVLESCEKLKRLIEVIKKKSKNTDMPNPLENVKSLLVDIHNKTEKVRADRFSIMIAGESKSGKSTFINAYLGIELLPMDIKQCTSAIVEIKNGNEFYVEATYANGRKEKVVGDSEARRFLKRNAALDDDYRDIPVPTINNEILVKSGLRAKEKNLQIKISKDEVEDLLNASEIKKANIHNIPSSDYNQKIRNYIEEKKHAWQDIVIKIEVRFPFGEEMRGIEIVDSPGVCAHGGVAEITSKYIESADAIIFLKPVSGQALESAQFNDFMDDTSVKRNKNALFLVLTRATNVTSDELRRLEEEAYKQFNNLDKRNILLVDSKAELYAKKFSTIDNIEKELQQLNKSGTLDDFVVKAYSDTKDIFGEGNKGDKGDFIRKLQEQSRFDQVYNSLEIFGRKAHYILLASLLDSICSVYEKLYSDLSIQMDMFRQKVEDPSKLAKKIAEVKKELDILNDKMYKGVDEVVSCFRGDNGVIQKKANLATEDFKTQVSLIDVDSIEAFTNLEKKSIEKIDEFKSLTKKIQENIVFEFDKNLIYLNDNNTIHFESLKPNFTELTFNEIRESTKLEADEINSYEDGVTFKKTHTYSEYSKRKHYKIIKNNIIPRLEIIKNDLIINLSNFVENIRDRYIDELQKNANKKKEELDAIMEAKSTSEQMIIIIENLNDLTKSISSAKAESKKIKGGIKKNVQ